MAISVGNSEPAQFSVGDSVSWTRVESDYQAPTWNLVYGFTGPTRFTITSADYNTTDHKMTMPITAGTVKAGQYTWVAYATDGTNRIQIGAGPMTALPDLGVANAELDALDTKIAAALAAWQSLAAKENISFSADGITYSKKNSDELWTYYQRLIRERNRLVMSDRALLGGSTGNIFLTRFKN